MYIECTLYIHIFFSIPIHKLKTSIDWAYPWVSIIHGYGHGYGHVFLPRVAVNMGVGTTCGKCCEIQRKLFAISICRLHFSDIFLAFQHNIQMSCDPYYPQRQPNGKWIGYGHWFWNNMGNGLEMGRK